MSGFLLFGCEMNTNQNDLQSLEKALESASEEMLNEIIREAEIFLDSQLRAGLASDQRAITFSSVVAAATAVLLGAFVTIAATNEAALSKVLPLVPVILFFMISMVCAFLVCRPTTFRYAGSNPRHWLDDITSKRKLKIALAGQAYLYAKGISENDCLLSRNASLMRYALISAALGVVFSFIWVLVVIPA